MSRLQIGRPGGGHGGHSGTAHAHVAGFVATRDMKSRTTECEIDKVQRQETEEEKRVGTQNEASGSDQRPSGAAPTANSRPNRSY